MATVAKLNENGELKLAGNINTRLPLVTDGLVRHHPFDGTTAKYFPSTIRYIRDWINGSTANTGNHWTELQVIDYSGVNRASGLTVTSDAGVPSNVAVITDGVFTNTNYSQVSGGALHYIELDLLDDYNIEQIITRHYVDSRTYHETKVEVSEDGVIWYSVFDSAIEGEYVEVTEGKTIDFNSLGSTVNPSVNTNTIKNDGVFIGSSTTNLYSDGQYSSKTLHTVRSGSWSFPDNIFGPDGQSLIKVVPSGANSYHGKDITITNGSDYTISCWIYVSHDCDTTVTELRGEQGLNYNVSYDLTKKGTWQHVSVSGVSTSTNARILVYETSSFTTGVIYFTNVQLEEKNHHTAYTDTTRSGDGALTIPFDLLPPYTIQFNHKSSWPIANQLAQATYPYIIQMNDYYTNASISYWNYGHNLRVNIKGDISSTWTATPSFYPFNAGNWDNIEHNYTLIAVNNTTFRVYVDGVQVGVDAVSTENVTNISKIMLGYNGDNEQATFRDFSIYDRVLTSDEVLKNAKGTHSFTTDNLLTNKVNSRPVLPDDCTFFDLGFQGDSYDNTVIASKDTANYDSGDAYVGDNSLEFNLNSSLSLDWNGDWSICYMKKPIGTHLGETDLTGYSIESLGCNSNSVGGGYSWWGKSTGSNVITASSNSSITPASYFDDWQVVTMVKSGTTLTIETWINDKVQRTRTITLSSIASNYFVTQYGYDFKLGGWDNNTGTYTHFKNLIVSKRALSSTELDAYRLQKMKAFNDEVVIQSGVSSSISL